MKLLDVTLQPSTAVSFSVAGEFTSAGSSEVACLKPGGAVELYRVTVEDGLRLVARVETRSILRSAAAVRFPGEKRDVLAVGADGGTLSVLDFGQTTTTTTTTSASSTSSAPCKILHCEVFGKTQCRRSTPGQYLAADPKGRAVMVAAVEKRKLVYVLNRDASGVSTLASPLEANKSRCITYAVAGVDNGYDNPIFACLERYYDEDGTDSPSPAGGGGTHKQLAYYELDLGLNHVSRKWATSAVSSTACCLVAVPGGESGPGGVLLGGEDTVEYVHHGVNRVACHVPRRKLHPADRGTLITTLTVFRQKKAKFFALAQSEYGDVFKVTLKVEDNAVVGMTVALLDTIPAATALHVSKLATLFCASEFGDHVLYRFERIELDGAVSCDSAAAASSDPGAAETQGPTFAPTMLQNLRKLDALSNPSPTSVLVGELAGGEVSPQIYTLTGRGVHSAVCVTRHGASVTELAVSELPGVPGGIFTIADAADPSGGRRDRFIVVSFADATLVLSVGETVEEVGKESGFLTNAPTLACSALGADQVLICQVHPSGVRQIHNGQAKQWNCPGLKRIETAAVNSSQVLIALAGGELIYFELDAVSGNLNETATRLMGADVCCLDVGTVPQGRSRSLFAVVGCRDMTIRVLSLEPGSLLVQKSSLALKSRPHSVALQTMEDEFTLLIGSDDGSSIRVSVDPTTGGMASTSTRRFLGARPVSVSRINLETRPAALLLSSRPWITRRDATTGKHVMAPLSYAPLDHGCSFSSEAVGEGVVATAGKTLRILAINSAGMDSCDKEAFNTKTMRLRYTPRQMTLMSVPKGPSGEQSKVVLAVVESDVNELSLEEKKSVGFDATGQKEKAAGADDAMDVDSDDEGNNDGPGNDDNVDPVEKESRWTPIRGPVPSSPGRWGSCIRLLDPSNSCETLDCVELGQNEAALCCASVRFHAKGGEALLAVGTVTGMTMHPLKQSSCNVALYRIVNGDRFQLLHRTPIDDGPVLALAHFQGRLLVGIGSSLRLYEMGKRQLLRKCELRGLPTIVKTIQTVGDRAFIGDMMQSVLIVKYDSATNRLIMVARDSSPRPIVSAELLDWNTVAVGDKYGNVSVLRLPRGSDAGKVDLTGQRALWDSSREDGVPKLELLCHYYVGEVVTGMTRSSLVAGGPESLIYVTITGRIGAFLPLTSRSDVDFFSQLDASLRKEMPRPTGRDPHAYRSYYAPAMHVVDGTFCDSFGSLTHDQQVKVADDLNRPVAEILKKLEDTRNSLL
jgi:splicing factor 3B subunit 3